MNEKIFTDYNERIDILRNRNMTINKRSSIHRNVIKNYNYYNVINAYKDLFLEVINPEEKYKSGTTPDQLLALYKFDENLRIILLRYILQIEEKIKHHITQSFFGHFSSSEQLTDIEKQELHRDTAYLNINYYDISSKEKRVTYSKFQRIVNNMIGRHYDKDNSSIKKYKDEHQYIPMWVLFNILMFGNISKYFTILKKEIKKDVMKQLGVTWTFQIEEETINQFESTLEILTLARNICAHNERLYCFQHNIVLKDRFLSFRNALPQPQDVKFKNRTTMKYSIYSVLFLVSNFINEKEKRLMLKEIDKEIQYLDKKLHTISVDDVLRYMNMNHNWYEKLLKV